MPTVSRIPGGWSSGMRAFMWFSVAASIAVLPLLSFWSLSAPFINKQRTILMFPAIVPRCSGVSPSLSQQFVGCSHASNNKTESSQPKQAAQWRGVEPFLSFSLMDTLNCFRKVIVVTQSAWLATCIRVSPCSFRKSSLHPFSTRI